MQPPPEKAQQTIFLLTHSVDLSPSVHLFLLTTSRMADYLFKLCLKKKESRGQFHASIVLVVSENLSTGSEGPSSADISPHDPYLLLLQCRNTNGCWLKALRTAWVTQLVWKYGIVMLCFRHFSNCPTYWSVNICWVSSYFMIKDHDHDLWWMAHLMQTGKNKLKNWTSSWNKMHFNQVSSICCRGPRKGS